MIDHSYETLISEAEFKISELEKDRERSHHVNWSVRWDEEVSQRICWGLIAHLGFTTEKYGHTPKLDELKERVDKLML